MQIGEKMSEVVDFEPLVYEGIEIYEDLAHFYQKRPLDAGRMFYVMMRRAIDSRIPIEVYWDHFSNQLTVYVSGEESGFKATYREWKMARSDMIERIDRIIDNVRRAEPYLLSQS